MINVNNELHTFSMKPFPILYGSTSATQLFCKETQFWMFNPGSYIFQQLLCSKQLTSYGPADVQCV